MDHIKVWIFISVLNKKYKDGRISSWTIEGAGTEKDFKSFYFTFMKDKSRRRKNRSHNN